MQLLVVGFWGLFAALFMAAPSAAAANSSTETTTLTFRAPDPGPVGDAVSQVLVEAYQQLGVELRFIDMPRSRSLVEANAGRIAGELGRLPDLDERFPNLTRGDFPLFTFQLVLVADRRQCGLCGLHEVKNLAFINGIQTALQVLKQHDFQRPTVQAMDVEQLHLMFSNNRVEAVLMNDFEARQLGYYDSSHLIITPLSHQVGYHYLHSQHAELLPALDQVLTQMHDNGRLKAIYAEYNVRFFREQQFATPPHYAKVSATAGLWRTLTHMDGSGMYWDLLRRIFAPVTDELELNTNSYQRAVLGLNENRFDMLIGGTLNQNTIDGIASQTHLDYDRNLYAFTLDQQALDQLLNNELERPVCYVAGYEFDTFFGNAISFYRANNSLDCFAMLDMGRMGAVVNYRENMPDWIAAPYVEHKLRDAVPIHVMFQDTPRGRELRDWFDKSLRELVYSGEIREIFTDEMLERSHLDLSLPPQ